MKAKYIAKSVACLVGAAALLTSGAAAQNAPPASAAPVSSAPARIPGQKDLLYMVTPGRWSPAPDDPLKYGGTGILVYDVKDNFRFVKRVPTWDYPASQQILWSGTDFVSGVAVSPATGFIYVMTPSRIAAFDLATEKKVWEQTYPGLGECCDRGALTPDGKTLYIPSGDRWIVADAATGKAITSILIQGERISPHNTIVSLDGTRAFLAGSGSPVMRVVDTKTNKIASTITFSDNVRPFTLNSAGTLVYANVDGLLGFEIGDVKTGKMLHRVEVSGFSWKFDERYAEHPGHGVPSHGLAMSPDEKEMWVTDGVNDFLHVFDMTVSPPKQVLSIKTRTAPYWITWGLDGKYVYSSTGDVIDAATKRVVAQLKDETGAFVETDKMVEVLFVNGKPIRTVDQFGVGLANRTPAAAAR